MDKSNNHRLLLVSLVDINAGKEVRKIKVGNTPVTTGITSDGKTLVVTVNGENALAIVDLSNNDSITKVPVGFGPAQVYLEPNDKYAFVANQGTSDKASDTVPKIVTESATAYSGFVLLYDYVLTILYHEFSTSFLDRA